jgi:hypothetical protein
MDVPLVDVTVHVDEALDEHKRQALERGLRILDGVVSVAFPKGKAHLPMVEYNPQRTTSQDILGGVRSAGLPAELVGM